MVLFAEHAQLLNEVIQVLRMSAVTVYLIQTLD